MSRAPTAFSPTVARLEETILACKMHKREALEQIEKARIQKVDARNDLYMYKEGVILRICDEISEGKIWWIPHLVDQMLFGVIDVDSVKGDKGDKRRFILANELLRHIRRILGGNKKNEIVKALLLFFEREFASTDSPCRRNEEGEMLLLFNNIFDRSYIKKMGVCPKGLGFYGPISELLQAKTDFPEDGLFYSFYRKLADLTMGPESMYWSTKFRIASGIESEPLIDFGISPSNMADLKQTRRWDLFDLYELTLTRRRVVALLLCAHEKCVASPIHRDVFPRDLFKIVIALSGLLPSAEEEAKLRKRAYYVPKGAWM